jgi:hypothetical protein
MPAHGLFRYSARVKTVLVLLSLALMSVTASAADQPSKSIVTDGHVYELRTYIATPGKLEQLHARFRNHTCKLLEKHGMKLIGFWVPQEADKGADNTLVYIVEHASRKAGEDSWKAFRADPEWVAAKAESEKNGSLTVKVESVYMNPTDYSKMK